MRHGEDITGGKEEREGGEGVKGGREREKRKGTERQKFVVTCRWGRKGRKRKGRECEGGKRKYKEGRRKYEEKVGNTEDIKEETKKRGKTDIVRHRKRGGKERRAGRREGRRKGGEKGRREKREEIREEEKEG